MQIEINGQRNITLDFDAPKKFKLFKDGAEVPYIRTGKNSFRLGRGVDGVVELEEVIEKPKIVKPMQLQSQQMALVNPNDVIMINQAAQQLEIEQGLLAETQKQVSYTQEYLDIQQQRINEAVAGVKALETDNAERIAATEGGIFNLAGEIANVENNANNGITLTRAEIESHENADNPHGITKKTIGLDKVDNTPDLDKPISKAVQSALDEKADKTEIEAIREEIDEYQEKNERINNALSSYTGGLASMSDHRELQNRDFPDQHPIGAITGLQNALDSKVNKTSESSKVYGTDESGNQTLYNADSFGKVDDVKVNGESVVEDKVANLGTMALENASDYSTKAVADTLYASISYEGTIDNHIADTNNPHEVTKSQVGLGNVDNTSDLDKPISTATQTALNDKADKATTLAGYGITNAYTKTEVDTALSGKQDSLDTAQMAAVNSGIDSTKVTQIATNTSDISNLQSGKADKATTLAGYGITNAYTKTEVDNALSGKQDSLSTAQLSAVNSGIDSTKVAQIATNTNDISSLQSNKADKATTLAGYGITNAYTKTEVDTALSGKQNNLDTTQMAAVNSGANTTNIGQIATNTSDIGTINGKIPSAASTSNQLADKNYVDTADNNLQSQIDAIVSSSDVFDIVGTYAELQAYDISTVPVNDIIKVLVDSTHSNAATYYRCVESGGVKSWSYIGSEGAYYTKSETDTLLQAKQDEITSSNKLSADLVDDTNSTNKFVTSSDISTWNAKQNALTAGTGIDITSNTISNSGVRSVSTGATNGTISVNTNGTSAEVSVYGLGSAAYTNSTAYDVSGAASTAETNAKNYADSLASNYATAAQGAKADTALQSGDNISELVNNSGYITGITSSDVTTALGYTPYDSSNPSGYTSNVGTVTSVNNTQPDANGNVTISTGGNYTAGTGIDITNNAISVTSPTLTNTATGINGLTINGVASNQTNAVNIGYNSTVTASNGTAIGAYTKATDIGATALGNGAHAQAERAIQLGFGTNSEANSFYVGTSSSDNWKMLDSAGLIPDARISSNIARTSDIPAAQVNSDWNAVSGVAQILNKPSLATVATTGAYSDLSGTPTVDQTYDGTSTNAQSGVAVAQALAGKADTDLSNLTSTGKAVIDGQWVNSEISLEYGTVITTTSTTGQTFTYDLSNYLPNDGNKYEIILCTELNGDTGGFYTIYGNPLGGIYVTMCKNYNSVGICAMAANSIIPMETSRTLYINLVNTAMATIWWKIFGYRRIGTNS